MPCTDYSCCDYVLKPFCLDIEHVVSIGSGIKSKEFASEQRNCSIPCLCFFLYELNIRFKNNKNIIRKIILPFSFGDIK